MHSHRFPRETRRFHPAGCRGGPVWPRCDSYRPVRTRQPRHQPGCPRYRLLASRCRHATRHQRPYVRQPDRSCDGPGRRGARGQFCPGREFLD